MSLFPASRQITLDAAMRDLRSGSPKARTLAAHALGDAGPADRDAARAALVKALDDDRHEVRAEAAASLGALEATGGGDPDDATVTAALIYRLDDGSPPVRQNAAIALGTLRHPAGFPALAQALRDGPVDLRFQAATSLCEIDPIAAFAPLVTALGDPDPQVVAAVALSLGATGDGRAAPHLARLLDHGEAAVRFDAAYALAQLGDRRARSRLVRALGDRDRGWDAITALEDLGDAASIPELAAVLVAKKIAPEQPVRAAAAILALAGADDGGPHVAAARAALIAALDHRKLPVRGLAVEQLARIGDAWAIAPLEALAQRRRSSDLQPAIADALAAIRDRATATATAGDAP